MAEPTDRDPLKDRPRVRDALSRPGGRVHMAGIGGVGMAGLALLLKARGWQVDGCDASDGPLLSWLRGHGIVCEVGHDPAHLETPCDLVVRSPAVSLDQPELATTMAKGIPVIERGRLLPALMDAYRLIAVAGTHGKTTTASMVAWILASSGRQVSYCIGGVCPCLGAVAHANPEGWMVVEADESDGTLRYYRPEIAVITSMDLDHVDYFPDRARQHEVFSDFANAADAVVFPAEDPDIGEMIAGVDRAVMVSIHDHRDADIAASEIRLEADAVSFTLRAENSSGIRVRMPVPGRHNIANALCAMAAAKQAGVTLAEAADALAVFRLPARRYEQVAEGNGIRVISDYAHHPVEINALIDQAALARASRMIAVFQPHRYSRTKAFLRDFAMSLARLDYVILAPVYAASEPFIAGGTSEELHDELMLLMPEGCELASSVDDAWKRLKQVWRSGDLVLIIGAGDVDAIGRMAALELS